MTRNHDNHEVKRNAIRPVRTPRLRLKAKAPQTGYVDGAWWPRSDVLRTELPDLLAVLSVRMGPIDRVLYKVNEWSTPPAKLVIGDRAVHLDGYLHQPPNSVEILGLNRTKIALLVVPPSTDAREAHTTMMAAAAPRNAATVTGLLGLPLRDRAFQSSATGTDQQRWEADGGPSRESALDRLLSESARP